MENFFLAQQKRWQLLLLLSPFFSTAIAIAPLSLLLSLPFLYCSLFSLFSIALFSLLLSFFYCSLFSIGITIAPFSLLLPFLYRYCSVFSIALFSLLLSLLLRFLYCSLSSIAIAPFSILLLLLCFKNTVTIFFPFKSIKSFHISFFSLSLSLHFLISIFPLTEYLWAFSSLFTFIILVIRITFAKIYICLCLIQNALYFKLYNLIYIFLNETVLKPFYPRVSGNAWLGLYLKVSDTFIES